MDFAQLGNLTHVENTGTSASRKKLTDELVTQILQTRAKAGLPYTYLGSSHLVAVNPFRLDEESLPTVQADHELDDPIESKANPCSFASRILSVAGHTGKSQSIVYSGISGSGKSFLSSLITEHFIKLAPPISNSHRIDEIRALETLVASFAQAKSLHHSSSSQCSRLLEIHFSPLQAGCSETIGVKLLTFGLNKHRLTRFSREERTFNIFYELLAGASPRERQELGLSSAPSDYMLLARSATVLPSDETQDPDVVSRDRLAFQQLRKAFEAIGLDSQSTSSIFRLLSFILNLFNLNFEQSDDQTCKVTSESWPALEIASALLGIQPEDLEFHLTNKTRFIKKDYVSYILTPDQCERQRDLLSITIYSILFAYIVETANAQVCPTEDQLRQNQLAGGSSILQLDLPGFQSKTANSGERQSLLKSLNYDTFSEFSINFSQELFQHWLSLRLLEDSKGDNARAVADGVSLTTIEHVDRSGSRMELLRGGIIGGKSDIKPGGIIGGLAQASSDLRKAKVTEEATDSSFLEQMRNSCRVYTGFSSNAGYGDSSNMFGIQHFAGTVAYRVNDFVSEDVDLVDPSSISLLRSSEDSFISRLISGPAIVTESHPKDPREVVTAQVSCRPLRLPSCVVTSEGEADNYSSRTASYHVSPYLNQLNSSISSMLSYLDLTHVWTVYALAPRSLNNTSSFVDNRFLKSQVTSLSLAQVVTRCLTDYPINMTHLAFTSSLEKPPMSAMKLSDLLKEEGFQENSEFAVGTSRVWLSFATWKRLGMHKHSLLESRQQPMVGGIGSDVPETGDKAELLDQQNSLHQARSSADFIRLQRKLQEHVDREEASSNETPRTPEEPEERSFLPTLDMYSQGSPNVPDFTASAYNAYDDSARTRSNSYNMPGRQSPDWSSDTKEEHQGESHAIEKMPESDSAAKMPWQEAEKVKGTSASRLFWLAIVWSLTWWIPDFILKLRKRFRRPDIRLAWREKVALCMLIFFFCGFVVSSLACLEDTKISKFRFFILLLSD